MQRHEDSSGLKMYECNLQRIGFEFFFQSVQMSHKSKIIYLSEKGAVLECSAFSINTRTDYKRRNSKKHALLNELSIPFFQYKIASACFPIHSTVERYIFPGRGLMPANTIGTASILQILISCICAL